MRPVSLLRFDAPLPSPTFGCESFSIWGDSKFSTWAYRVALNTVAFLYPKKQAIKAM
jgi:hypothetical protein